MEKMWMLTSEVLVEPGDLPSGSTKGFVNVTTWAESPQTAEEKLSRYLDSFTWHLIPVKNAHPNDKNRDYGEEIEGMIERTRNNPTAIILGRFFSYKEN